MEIKSEIRWFDVVESTNDEVRKHISELDNLSVIAADYQTKGRGQGDHKWHSRSGENLRFASWDSGISFNKRGSNAT